MSRFPTPSDRLASINAIIQGDLKELRPFLDDLKDIEDRLSNVEGVYGGAGEAPSKLAEDVSTVSVPGEEARAPEVRDAVIEIANSLNALIEKLNGE